MLIYIAKRFLYSLLTIYIVITITFFLMHAIPGKFYAGEKALPASVMKSLDEKYGLDKPLMQQYFINVSNITKLDFGVSMYKRGRSVNDIIKQHFPVSALIGSVSIILALTFGILFGIIAAMYHNRWQDYLFMFIATIGVTIPGFVMASIAQYIFGVKLGILPVMQLKSVAHMVMPCITLSFFPLSFITRLIRSSMLEVMEQDYVRTARSKGLSERLVVYKHALKNAILPVITYLGPMIAFILTGSFVIEKIFAIPGLGRFFIESIGNRDYTVIMGTTVFLASIVIVMNFIVDILYLLVDPRIKLNK